MVARCLQFIGVLNRATFPVSLILPIALITLVLLKIFYVDPAVKLHQTVAWKASTASLCVSYTKWKTADNGDISDMDGLCQK